MIRPAIPADAAALRAMVDAAYRPYIARIGKPPGPMLDDYARRIADAQAWVLEEDGQVLGILVLEARADALLLDNVAVCPAQHGHGHGRTLMAFAEEQARRRGLTQVTLYTHVLMAENRRLYARLGYRETRRVTEDGFDRVYMTKVLAPGPGCGAGRTG